ncbi:MAG: hypothetical protein ACFFDN_08675 [Candidatus Hodarchaeota archaeon]
MSFNNFLYNFSEYALSSLFRVITGIKIRYREKLDEIWIYQLEEKDTKTLNSIEDKIWKEFKIKTKLMPDIIEIPKKVRRGNFIVTTDAARIVNDKIERPKDTALLFITKYAITPFPFLTTRILQTIFPILGASYILYGICFITTFNERLQQEIIDYAAIHEIGHLLGKHGYPLK